MEPIFGSIGHELPGTASWNEESGSTNGLRTWHLHPIRSHCNPVLIGFMVLIRCWRIKGLV